MGLTGRVCSKGIWDESIPGISFEPDGSSNYALLYNRLAEAYPRGLTGKKQWDQILDKINVSNKRGKYNCIIGVSGGTDSSYLLYLAKQQNLRPLAVNLDNGWSSDIAVKNIKKMTTALNIDLETYVIEYEEVKDLLRSYMLACLPWVDIPSDLAIKAILYRIAARENVKYILRGNDFRSEGSQPDEWTYGDAKQLKAIHKQFGRVQLRTFPNYTLFNLLQYGFVKGIKSIYPYYYIDYHKGNAQAFLKDNFSWEYYGGHHHENIFTKFAISYWLPKKFGIDKRIITLSAQVMSGEITRQDALTAIAKPAYDENTIQFSIDYVLKKLDLTHEQFQRIMASPNKSFADYPSSYYLFKNLLKYTTPVLNLVFLHKPQSIFQAEMRNNTSGK